MKSKIFLYLFIFSLLIILFLFMNAKKAQESHAAKVANLEAKIAKKNSMVDSLIDLNLEHNYFSLQSDDEAQSYLEEMGYNAKEIELTISDQLIAQNKAGADNPIVPYEGMEGNMTINKVRLLNHKWIIADFTDGVYWGQLFILYDIRDDGVIDFAVERSFLYPR